MTRAFRADPLGDGVLERMVDLASRAPSAGKTQGWHLLVLEGADTARYWDLTLPDDGSRAGFRWTRLLDAPVLMLALADPTAYVDRYAEPDKARTGLGTSVDAWPAPYWTIDASMSVMTLLLAAEDEGLGALFFGVFRHEAAVRSEFSIPDHVEMIGAIALGHPHVDPDDDAASSGRSSGRRRRPAEEIIHRSHW